MKEDLKAILNYIKGYTRSRKLIFITVLVFILIGFFHGCTTYNKYESSSKFLVQLSDEDAMKNQPRDGGKVIGATFSGDIAVEDIPVLYYPKIIQSSEFRKELLKTQIYIEDIKREVSLREYILEYDKPDGIDILLKYTLGLPGMIFGGSEEPSKIIDSLNYKTPEELKLDDRLENSLEFLIDEEDGSNILTATLTDRVGAAQVAISARDLLQKKVVEYRILKAKRKFEFIDKEYEEKKVEFYATQAKRASYMDRNRFNITEQSQITKNRLEMEYNTQNLAFSELEASRVRQAIKVEEDTPAFITLQSPSVPLEPANLSTPLLVIIYAIVGLLVSILVYVVRSMWVGGRTLWKENEELEEEFA